MGKAIIISGADYSAKGLGVVSLPGKTITPQKGAIYSATTFRVVEDGVFLANVSWSISDSTLASLVSNADGSCTVTPLLNINSSAVTGPPLRHRLLDFPQNVPKHDAHLWHERE